MTVQEEQRQLPRAAIVMTNVALVVMWITVATLTLVSLSACQPTSPGETTKSSGGEHGWLEVAARPDPDNGNALVRVFLDTLGGRRLEDGSYLIWLKTYHTRPRTEQGRQFDLELLRFTIRCSQPGDGAYKRVSATLLYGDEPPVYQEAVSVAVALGQPWVAAKPGTLDLLAFTKACELIAPRLRSEKVQR